MHGNNVVWLCAIYAVDANLFRLESLILTRVKRATNRNNVGGNIPWGNIPGWNVPGGRIPRTWISWKNEFFLNNFSISVVLILHHQLSFPLIGRFPGKTNWTGALLDFASLSNVLEIGNTSQNWSTTCTLHRVFSWNTEVQLKSSPRGCDGFCFEVFLNTVRLPEKVVTVPENWPL